MGHDDDRDELLTGLCDDCGVDYVTRPDNVSMVCGGCSVRRAAWAVMTQIRMAQASARVKAVA